MTTSQARQTTHSPLPGAAVAARWAADPTLGMALHYLTLYALAVGLSARRTLEFGAGASTAVILAALGDVRVSTGREEEAVHVSCSHESQAALSVTYGVPGSRGEGPDVANNHWAHLVMDSARMRADANMNNLDGIDLVLHDGSHDEAVVRGDLAWVLPKMRQFGLVLVHDTAHEHCGEAVRGGVLEALADVHGQTRCNVVSLPYGFGLTILRVERQMDPATQCERAGQVEPQGRKAGSRFTTRLDPEEW